MAIPTLARLSRLSAPTFKIRVGGLLSSPVLDERLVSISVTLNNGEVSDHLSLEFDDRSTIFGGISIPTQGVVLSVSLGYEAYSVEMGEFVVNRVSSSGSGGGRRLNVSATPSLLVGDFTRTWAGSTIGEIVGAIAQEYNLTAKVSPTLKFKTIDVVNQLNESNSAFLTRLAARFNAVCKPMAGNLLFMAKGEGTSATGLPMPPVAIPPHDVMQWDKSINEQFQFKRVCAYWFDHISASDQEVYVPSGPPKAGEKVLRLPHLFNNEAEATAAAQASFDEIRRDDESLRVTMIGNPDITAEGGIVLTNFRTGVDGSYIVKSATHSLNQGGYQTTIGAYVEP